TTRPFRSGLYWYWTDRSTTPRMARSCSPPASVSPTTAGMMPSCSLTGGAVAVAVGVGVGRAPGGGSPPRVATSAITSTSTTTSPATTNHHHHGHRRDGFASPAGTSSTTRGLSTELSSGAESAEYTTPCIRYVPGATSAGTTTFTG